MGVMFWSRVVNEASYLLLLFYALVRPNYLMRAALSELYLSTSVTLSKENSINSVISAGRAKRRYTNLVLSSLMAGFLMENWAST